MRKIGEKVIEVDFEKYRGQELAMVDGKIVASGFSPKEVFKQARDKYPEKDSGDILLISVPKEIRAVY